MDFAQIIRESVTSREMLERMGVAVDRRGMACCPFHGEKTPSLKVYRDPSRGWHCFGCHRGGSVIDLVMMEHGLRFRDAMKKINEDFDLVLPIGKPQNDAERRRLALEIEARRATRARKENALRAAEAAYWRAYDAWLENDRTIAEHTPSGFAEPDEAYIGAIMRREEVKEELNAAEEQWAAARAR